MGGHFVFGFQLTFFDEVLRRVAALPALVLHRAMVLHRAIVGRHAGKILQDQILVIQTTISVSSADDFMTLHFNAYFQEILSQRGVMPRFQKKLQS